MLFTKKEDGTLVLVEGDDLAIYEEIADIDEAQRKTRILLGKADDDDEEEEDEDVASVVEHFFEWSRRPSPPPNSPASDAAESESEVSESDVTNADQDVAKPEPVAGI